MTGPMSGYGEVVQGRPAEDKRRVTDVARPAPEYGLQQRLMRWPCPTAAALTGTDTDHG